MYQQARDKLGGAGLIVEFVALIVALAGGAYVTSSNSGGETTASAKGKAKRGPAGPRGPNGATGPAGPAGASGTTPLQPVKKRPEPGL